MNILIYGAGAIGQYIAVRLAALNNSVAVIAREKFVDKINKRGIKLSNDKNDQKISSTNIKAFKDLKELSEKRFDYIFITVKAYDLISAVKDIKRELSDPKIVILQNGAGNEENATLFLKTENIFSAALTTSVRFDDNKDLISSGKGGLGIASLTDKEPAELYDLMSKSGIVTSIYSSYKDLKWSKLVLNIIGNASSAILNMTASELFNDDRIFEIEIKAIKEIFAIMKRERIKAVNLPGFPVIWLKFAVEVLPAGILQNTLKKIFSEGRGQKDPSLSIDIKKCAGKSEIDFLNGVVYSHKGYYPANKILTDIYSGIHEGSIPKEKYDKNPKNLYRYYTQELQNMP